MNSKRLMAVAGACMMALMLRPAEASAQRRASGGHTAVVARGPIVRSSYSFYRPYYRPYYDPFFFGSFYYDPFYLGWYPNPYAFYGDGYGYGYGDGYQYRPGYYYGARWSAARIEIKPRQAQVFLDGYYVGIVDQFDGIFQRLDVPVGEHDLTVYLAGYRTYSEKTLFRPGQTYHFKAVLEPLPPGAQAEPPPQPTADRPDPYGVQGPYGANPNGRYPGNPNAPGVMGDPYRQPPPPPEPGDEARTRPMPQRPGDRRADTGNFGTLAIRVQPVDASVTIDGERWDSPEGGSRLIVQLSGGSHRIEVRKDGYKPYSSTVDIRPGETSNVNISLPQGQQ